MKLTIGFFACFAALACTATVYADAIARILGRAV